jgi:hypothetical protein
MLNCVLPSPGEIATIKAEIKRLEKACGMHRQRAPKASPGIADAKAPVLVRTGATREETVPSHARFASFEVASFRKPEVATTRGFER